MIAKDVLVGALIHPTTNPSVRRSVRCGALCGFVGPVADAAIADPKKQALLPGHVYICCPRCGAGLVDLGTDQPRRWV
jgi:hypothetical protein